MTMCRLLLVDDKEMMRDSVAATLARHGYEVTAAPDGATAIQKLSASNYDLVLTDLQMPNMCGLELLRELRQIDDQLPVILMTAYGTVETAVRAMKEGAFDYLTKPFSGDELVVAVERAADHGRLVRENEILRAASNTSERTSSPMVGSSDAMEELSVALRRLTDSQGTVLISGESGSGKEVAARWIHDHSPRSAQPFLALNCAALSPSLLESELFGHEKGAFTGADRARKGRFELADGGTLLLDEISEISLEMQAKLLRVLQEQTFERVGASSSLSVDVRVIATTNRELAHQVAHGAFRQDLFFRLNVLPLEVPPLRNRLVDVPELVEHFLTCVAAREGKPLKRMEAAALQLLERYPWPGNVRELQNICERAAVLTTDELIPAALIKPWLSGDPAQVRAQGRKADMTMEVAPFEEGDCPSIVCDGTLKLHDVERETIIATLYHNKGHRQRSADALGIGVRTLGLKLKKWKEQHLVAQSL
jgi:DNA-binding NtrC family response regulator